MKMRRYVFILMALVGILLFPSGVSAFDLKLTYSDELDGCIYETITIPSYDNNGNIEGYLFVHDRGVIKHNLNNKVVYMRKLDTSNIDISTIDSSNSDGYVVKGKSDLLFTFYDDNDNVIFEKQYGGSGDEREIVYFKSYDDEGKGNGYISIIESTSHDLNVEPGYIVVKFDLHGNVIYEESVNNYLKSNYLYYIDNTVGYVFNISSKAIKKIDLSTNQTVWEKSIGFFVGNINYSYDKNGVIDGIVVTAGGYDNDYVGTLIKYDLNGNEIFRASYDGTVESFYTDVISSYLPDGSYDGYIVTGTISGDNQKSFLIKYDFNGKKVFEKNYSDTTSYWFGIVDNYDNNGRRNGYLLYENLSRPYTRVDSDSINTHLISCDFVIAKYIYDMFPVAKEETSGGTITVKSDAYPGEMVKVKVLVKEGYSLARIIVKDESGKEIEVNSDGTFVMPEGKVTVSAIYKRVTNPDTVSAAYMVLGIVLLIAVGSLIVIKNKNRDM